MDKRALYPLFLLRQVIAYDDQANYLHMRVKTDCVDTLIRTPEETAYNGITGCLDVSNDAFFFFHSKFQILLIQLLNNINKC